MPLASRLIRIGMPIALIFFCAFLWFHIARNNAALDAVPSAVGPGGWPRAMLIGLFFFATLTLIHELLQLRKSIRHGLDDVIQEKESLGSQALAALGVAIILVYGFSIPYVGFAFATVAFIAIWCVLGKVRSLITVTLVSVLGTVVLLYMFVALAKMPLNRGIEPFNSATVSIYRLLRIF